LPTPEQLFSKNRSKWIAPGSGRHLTWGHGPAGLCDVTGIRLCVWHEP
jgi:hypothetical protein